MSRVSIQPAALVDIDSAAAEYESKQQGLGIEFILEFDATTERIANFPRSYSVQFSIAMLGVRYCVGFPKLFTLYSAATTQKYLQYCTSIRNHQHGNVARSSALQPVQSSRSLWSLDVAFATLIQHPFNGQSSTDY